jgi:hypothetical protein
LVLTEEERRLKVNERARKWREANPEKVNAIARKSYQKNKEKISKRNKITRATPEFKAKAKVLKDKWDEENKEHSQKYREGRRDEFNAQQKKSNYIRKNKVLAHYSKNNFPECVCCGEKSNLIFLTLDHIEGRKNVTHKKRLGGKDLYAWIEKNNFPSGYQTLCHNCNSAKSDSEMCPHQRSLK